MVGGKALDKEELMKIITTVFGKAYLCKLLKEAYIKGLNIGYDIGYQARKIDERNQGAIMPGYDLDKDLDEILKRKG